MSALEEKSLVDILREEFQDEDYRYAYDEEFSNSRMATQIKVIREHQGLKQTELAELAEMKQSRISALEDVNYNAWSISTLRRLARALGVRVFFGFESWGELLPEIESFGRKSLERPEFKKDPAFKDATEFKDHDLLTQTASVFDKGIGSTHDNEYELLLRALEESDYAISYGDYEVDSLYPQDYWRDGVVSIPTSSSEQVVQRILPQDATEDLLM